MYLFLDCTECEYSMNTARIQTESYIVPNYQIEEALLYDTFPEGFEWGAATSAYQVNSSNQTQCGYARNLISLEKYFVKTAYSMILFEMH